MKKIGLMLAIAVLLLVGSVSATISDNIVSYYDMNSTTNNTMLDSLGNYDGTVFNSFPDLSTGLIDKGYEFIGSNNDGVDTNVPIDSFTDDTFSVNFWVKPDMGVAQSVRVLATGSDVDSDNTLENGFIIQLNNNAGLADRVYLVTYKNEVQDNTFLCYSGSSSCDSSFPELVDVWSMITVTYDGVNNVLKLYYNATELASTTIDLDTHDQDLMIGPYFGSRFNTIANFDGDIDELGIWNKTLNNSEIAQLYNDGVGYSPLESMQTNETTQPTGSGTQADPYRIYDCEDLRNIGSDLDAYYKLENDIDCSGTTYTSSIGGCGVANYQGIDPFSGELDGNGKKISNYKMSGQTLNWYDNAWRSWSFGLFSCFDGDVYDLTLENFDIESTAPFSGIFTGWSTVYNELKNISIINSTLEVNYTTDYFDTRIGSLCAMCGRNDIEGIAVDENTKIKTLAQADYFGGIVARTGNTPLDISNSYFLGSVEGEISYSGGILGLSPGFSSTYITVDNTYAVPDYNTVGVANPIVGLVQNDNKITVTNTYWSNESTGLNTTTTYGTGKSDLDMKKQSTFSGWDFSNIWIIDQGNDYPRLKIEGYTCEDNDGDGYGAYCSAGPDCDDTDANVLPIENDGSYSVQTEFCPGTYELSSGVTLGGTKFYFGNGDVTIE
jgi:hypothetical protein